MSFTASSTESPRTELTRMPYFFWKASMAGRPNWLTIWVVYQVTWPSFLAAAISASSAACEGGTDASMPIAQMPATRNRQAIASSSLPPGPSPLEPASLTRAGLPTTMVHPRPSNKHNSASPCDAMTETVPTTTPLTWIRETRAPNPLPPPKSCDCQFHIYGDPKKYPPKKGAYYQPPDATFEHMRGVLKTLGFERGVIVHPMPYDTDHRLLIDTLSALNPKDRDNFRATGIVKHNVTDADMARLNELGVRGARFNIGRRYQETTSRDAILRSIARVREIGWHMRLHITGDDIIPDADFLRSIKGITVCVDHMGHLHVEHGIEQPACRFLIDMLKHE